jgi:hypothetical protein
VRSARFTPPRVREDVEIERRGIPQAFHVERVPPLAALSFDDDESRFEKTLEMASHGRPRTVEAVGKFACSHCVTASVQHEQEMAAGLIGEGGEDRVDVVEVR